MARLFSDLLWDATNLNQESTTTENIHNIKRRTMKTCKMALLAATSALALFLTTGCDRTVSSTETEKVKHDGSVETKEKKVTESPDGTIKKEEEKKTTPPQNP
jgi:hypothetical protein